ncbi:MAG TPA: family 43 glycosylhydrolase [Phenylobacterium sp.]
MRLPRLPDVPFEAEAELDEAALTLTVREGATERRYRLRRGHHGDWLDMFEAMAADFGVRVPLNRRAYAAQTPDCRLEPVLIDSSWPEILYGFGDPCVAYAEDERAWYLTATSNDAPNAFPILRSADLKHWDFASFAFPQGAKPAWAADGPGSDFWAPELHRIGEAWWLVFTARRPDGSLAIGLGVADRPAGPFTVADQPLLGGGVIDSHIFVDEAGVPFLVWKEDTNGVWPRLLAERLQKHPQLIGELFDAPEDRRTAAMAAVLQPLIPQLHEMEQFFTLQLLIEAAAQDLTRFEGRLQVAMGEAATPMSQALRTRIFAQPISPDGRALTGDPRLILQNDQPWEAHLIEGPWITRQAGRWYLFYAANDFSTAEYGLGVAIADHPLGPWRKQAKPILRSGPEWVGPGHASVAPGADGQPRLFLHAFYPGALGYKAFRAVLAAEPVFEPGGVWLR